MAEWLRPVFARSKTNLSETEDSSHNEDLTMPSLGSASRVSSFVGSFHPSTPSSIMMPDSFSSLRAPESLYYRPSGDQMAETLKVVMMTQKDFMDPLPIEYNSAILHVLEAYQDLRQQLLTKQETVEQLKQSHTKDIKEFETLASQWEAKEKEYKADIKRLEVIISKTDNGMETVSLTRSESVVHGSKTISETIGRGVASIRERHAARQGHSRERSQWRRLTDPLTVHTPLQVSEPSFRSQDNTQKIASPHIQTEFVIPEKRVATPFLSRLLHPQGSRTSLKLADVKSLEIKTPETKSSRSDGVLQSPTPTMKALTKEQLDALERQQALEDLGIAFYSSTSASSESFMDHPTGTPRRFGLGIDIAEKPLPDIPSSPRPERSRPKPRPSPRPRQAMSELLVSRPFPSNVSSEQIIPKQMSFSFRPGDDDIAGGLEKQKASSFNPNSSPDVPGPRRQKAASNPIPRLVHSKEPERIGESVERHSMVRDDSASSIVTAVRNNSGTSSLGSSLRTNSQIGRPRLDRKSGSGSGSNESVAIYAAARAMARHKPSNTNLRVTPGSGSGSRPGSGSGSGSKERRESGDYFDWAGSQEKKMSSVNNHNNSSTNASNKAGKKQERQLQDMTASGLDIQNEGKASRAKDGQSVSPGLGDKAGMVPKPGDGKKRDKRAATE